jgi:hypothetical protein
MVLLDIRNSRMKDFYDIWLMANLDIRYTVPPERNPRFV